jgi:hypothetical protein
LASSSLRIVHERDNLARHLSAGACAHLLRNGNDGDAVLFESAPIKFGSASPPAAPEICVKAPNLNA